MDTKITEIAERVRALRDIMDISQEEMAQVCGLSLEEYQKREEGKVDFSVTFLYNCAGRFGVDLMELMTGETPRLKKYSLVRKGKGLDVKRRESFVYEHMAYSFANKTAEPFYVEAPYLEEEQKKPIQLSTHEGQEFDYILEGQLKVSVDGHTEIMGPGDAIYYDSGTPHGMIAVGGQKCVFLAVVIKNPEGKESETC